jgi:hypothetical protein
MKKFRFLSLALILVISMLDLAAQKLSSVEDRMNGMKKLPGYFNLYWDDVPNR